MKVGFKHMTLTRWHQVFQTSSSTTKCHRVKLMCGMSFVFSLSPMFSLEIMLKKSAKYNEDSLREIINISLKRIICLTTKHNV